MWWGGRYSQAGERGSSAERATAEPTPRSPVAPSKPVQKPQNSLAAAAVAAKSKSASNALQSPRSPNKSVGDGARRGYNKPWLVGARANTVTGESCSPPSAPSPDPAKGNARAQFRRPSPPPPPGVKRASTQPGLPGGSPGSSSPREASHKAVVRTWSADPSKLAEPSAQEKPLTNTEPNNFKGNSPSGANDDPQERRIKFEPSVKRRARSPAAPPVTTKLAMPRATATSGSTSSLPSPRSFGVDPAASTAKKTGPKPPDVPPPSRLVTPVVPAASEAVDASAVQTSSPALHMRWTPAPMSPSLPAPSPSATSRSSPQDLNASLSGPNVCSHDLYIANGLSTGGAHEARGPVTQQCNDDFDAFSFAGSLADIEAERKISPPRTQSRCNPPAAEPEASRQADDNQRLRLANLGTSPRSRLTDVKSSKVNSGGIANKPGGVKKAGKVESDNAKQFHRPSENQQVANNRSPIVSATASPRDESPRLEAAQVASNRSPRGQPVADAQNDSPRFQHVQVAVARDILPGETPKEAAARRKREAADREMARIAETTVTHIAVQPVKPRTVSAPPVNNMGDAEDTPWSLDAAKQARGIAARAVMEAKGWQEQLFQPQDERQKSSRFSPRLDKADTGTERAAVTVETAPATVQPDARRRVSDVTRHNDVRRWASDGNRSYGIAETSTPPSPRRVIDEEPLMPASRWYQAQRRSSAPATSPQPLSLAWATAEPDETPREAARRRKCEAADRDMLHLKAQHAEVAGSATQAAAQLRDSHMHTFSAPYANGSADDHPLQELPGSSLLTFA